MKIKFWGVRGSIPSPLTPLQVREKIWEVAKSAHETSAYADLRGFFDEKPFWQTSTYGGNTSCVELLTSGGRFILDMGTGLRSLGHEILYSDIFQRKETEAIFCLSHVHWDHIQGLPFFAPLYINKERGVKNRWKFYGGTDWQRRAEICLQGQMDPPNFPVSWSEIRKINQNMEFNDVYDMMKFVCANQVKVTTRKLNHPQETYGYRFEERNGPVVVYATDNEPYDPMEPDPPLLELASSADILIIDCQYTQDQYNGKKNAGGVPRHGWGHSYDVAVAKTAVMAKVKIVILFHHDPSSSDKDIWLMERGVQNMVSEMGGASKVIAAHEGLELNL